MILAHKGDMEEIRNTSISQQLLTQLSSLKGECVLSGGGPGPPEGGRQNISLLPFIAIFVSEF